MVSLQTILQGLKYFLKISKFSSKSLDKQGIFLYNIDVEVYYTYQSKRRRNLYARF